MTPTSRPSTNSSTPLQKSLQQLLSAAKAARPVERLRVAILGIGHELCGDDAAGVLIVRALQPLAVGRPHLLVLDAGPAPENFTGPLRRFAPDLVLLVDAAQMDEPPGTLRCLAWQDTSGFSASTHTLPPYVLAGYLSSEMHCHVGLLGIQPAQNILDTPLSPVVAEAVAQAVQAIREAFIPSD